MGAVLHFMSDRMEKPACGAQVFLCSDYTDNQQYVDRARCKRTKAFRDYDARRFRVDVWSYDGDVIDQAHAATAEEVDDFRERYGPYSFVLVEEI